MRHALVVPALLVTASLAQAAPNVASTSKKGSVLVFPDVVSTTVVVGNTVVENRTTIIRIVNDGTSTAYVHCEFMDGDRVGASGTNPGIHSGGGMVFALKKNQPMWFDVKTGGVSTMGGQRYPTNAGVLGEGLLVCFAVNAGDTNQVRRNELAGTATVFDLIAGTAYEYTAWAFAALTAPLAGEAGTIMLDGVHYDSCPAQLEGIAQSPEPPFALSQNRIAVALCNFDVRQAEDQEALRTVQWARYAPGSWYTMLDDVDAWYTKFLETKLDGQYFTVQVKNGAPGLVAVQSRPATLPTNSGTALSVASDAVVVGKILWDPADPIM